MLDIFSLIVNLFSDILSFLDSFIILGSVSILKLLFIIFLFNIAFKFLIHNKRGD